MKEFNQKIVLEAFLIAFLAAGFLPRTVTADLRLRRRLAARKLQKVVHRCGGDIAERFLREKGLVRGHDNIRHGNQPHQHVIRHDLLRAVLIEQVALFFVHVQTRRADLSHGPIIARTTFQEKQKDVLLAELQAAYLPMSVNYQDRFKSYP